MVGARVAATNHEPGCRLHRRVRGAAFGLLGHGSLLCDPSRTDAACASSWRTDKWPTRVMASCGASVNPLTAVLDRSEIAERPPRGRRIRSQRARDTGRERQRAPTEWRSKNISQITQVAVKARQRPFQEGLHHETRNLSFGRR